ncbi:lipid-A-disaccharide synthase N-terminal domain-containing protein [Porphyromonas somerae]|uniref:lipid-A-disaccharide synthase N-terminal domain-containing protein n=1 Tax=Porphyromonas somerae TaxID=322095 RepID=UPI002A74ED5B|nr:lipid-A-disaccharide synthase N-terminal domain-containing protein [Porphyromonas somerae]MDY3120422.1 lipid-A-disaccharide synthase N-terminal domain-containing protein [Porphyromonas somerae]
MSSNIAILSIGFLAQAFFSARTWVQWILSEKANKVLSPTIIWVLSLLGAYLLCIYGWLRNDFAIILGQFISYYIYLANLKLKGVWQRLPQVVGYLLLATPIVAVAFVAQNASEFVARFLHNEEVALWLLIFGSVGQVLFTLRFVYQWIYSQRRKESQLPAGFWIISLTGSLLILTYGIIRADAVLIVGQMFGAVAYARNLWIITHEKKNS